jgi:hypothetical protein
MRAHGRHLVSLLPVAPIIVRLRESGIRRKRLIGGGN